MAGKHDKQGSEAVLNPSFPLVFSEAGVARHSAEPPRSRARTVALVVLAAAGSLLALYLAGVIVFSQVLFLPGTSLNGEDVSLRPVRAVASSHSEATSGYELAVFGQGLVLSVSASEVGLAADGRAYVSSALGQINSWAWPAELFGRRSLEVDKSTTYDEDRLGRLVESAVSEANEGATPPIDAELAYDDEAKAYVVKPEQLGTQIDAQAVKQTVGDALTELVPTLRLTDEVLLRPAVLSDDRGLKETAGRVNAHLGATQTLTVRESPVYEVGSDRIVSWVTVDDALQVSVNTDAVNDWATGELSDQLDSMGSERAFTRPDGKGASVAGGTYGWVINGEELARLICENIQAGTKGAIEIPMLEEAAQWNPGGQDWPARYVDIDLSEQYVRFYGDDGGLAWESPCVSGNVSQGHDTPTGVYFINDYMQSGNVELRGRIDPATNEPEYISYVTYWMPFIDNAWALHDASWRGSFGGDIYQYNGSHGCVNLPTDAAASLYAMVHVGDVVVVHY